jgi:8-oxo-dGTP diphosphatase
LQKILNNGIKLIQARLKNLSAADITTFIDQAYSLCQLHQAMLLVNSAVDYAGNVDGLHLTSHHLMTLTQRPNNIKWLAASCHNLEQLQHAQNMGVDFAVLAPVLSTLTHPGTATLGWGQFAELVSKVNLPVYALAGMTTSSLPVARQSGGQGIAAIRAFLD